MFKSLSIFLLATVLIFTVMVEFVVAAPFLVCDPPLTTEWNSTDFEYRIFGIPNSGGTTPPTGIVVDAQAVGSTYGFKYDIGYLPAGAQTLTVKACNIYGCSVSSDPFNINPGIPGKPGGFGVIP